MPNSNITNVAYTNPASGISYTNKDFNSIYSEELDTVKELTKRWDPTISNESDPGVVLLKENAIIADKENYNIDKNVLEVFPLSVSQYGNARQLYDSLGYEMKWYRAATTEFISYKYKGSADVSDDNPIDVEKFTMVADSTGEYIYTIINPQPITEKDKSYRVTAMQGVIQDLIIGGQDTITLANLDADLRVYLPDTMVAENGIFICNKGENNWDTWVRVSNIEGQSAYGKEVYSFGVLPNSNTCYIQFPQDIADLIRNGLNIKYIITLGEVGNIPANTIESFYSNTVTIKDGESGVAVSAEDLVVTNLLAIDNGENPEDLRSAYRNFKKTIGTFDTLVTCRDYENNIYSRVYEDTETPIVSNVVVSDRTNDINYSHNVITLTQEGNEKELAVSVKSGTDKPEMTAFDLGLYLLEPLGSVYNATNYAKSFSVNKTYQSVKQSISSVKSLQHDYIDTQVDKPFILKNFYDLTGKVITYYKVTEEEASDIEKKIANATYTKFNAREVDFGVPADYDYLVETIKNADSRIKSVILNEPVYETYVMTGREESGTYNSSNTYKLTDFSKSSSIEASEDIIANLIANGNVQLYKFDPDFQYGFGENVTGSYKNISSVKTKAAITVPNDPDDPYPIKENETVLITSQSFVPKVTYTYHTQYKWTGSSIVAGEMHTLLPNESLTLKWVADGTNYEVTYKSNTRIKPSINISESNEFKTLGQTETIQYMEENKVEFGTVDNPAGENLLCYWVVNNHDNILFEATATNAVTQEKILDENEYFIYTDAQKSDIVVLGNGTKISRTGTNMPQARVDKVDITTDNLTEEATKLEWYDDFTNLTIAEQDIISLGKGVKISTSGANSIDLTNTFIPLTQSIIYVDADNNSTTISSSGYSIRSRLDIVSPIGNPQKLLGGQSFTFTLEGSASPERAITECTVEFNYGISRVGGENVDLATIDSAGKIDYRISALAYTGEDMNSTSGYIAISPVDAKTSAPHTKTLNVKCPPSTSGTDVIIPFIVTGDSGKVISVVAYSSDEADGNQYLVNNILPGSNYIKATTDASGNLTVVITFTDNTSTDVSVLLGRVNPYNGYYLSDYLETLNLPSSTTVNAFMDAVVAEINNFSNYNTNARYDLSYRVPEDDLLSEPLSAESFWDVDNPYNRFTIPQMRNCNVTVIKSSKA